MGRRDLSQDDAALATATPAADDMARAKEVFFGACRRAQGVRKRDQANAALDEALALADAMPAENDVQQAAARALAQLGRLAEAALYLEGQLKRLQGGRGREATEARADLAQLYLRLGRLHEATTLLHAEDSHGPSLLLLGSALRYRGRLEAARAPIEAAYRRARAEKDLVLAVAARCAQGELELDAGNPKAAVVAFGEALGLTEHSEDEALSVMPLAGLGQAHGAWGYPAKGRQVAEKALGRVRAEDRVARARVLLTLGLLANDLAALGRALAEADAAPHLPLALKCLVALAERAPGALNLAEAMHFARGLGMDLDLHRLLAAANAPTSS